MDDIESRLAELEAKVEAWETRRRKLIPTAYDHDPIVQGYVRNQMHALHHRVIQRVEEEKQQKIRENPLYAALYEGAEKAMREHALKENLETLEAIERYQKTGEVPEGWEINDPGRPPVTH
jgi:predicted RNase H-like nuclease (RuvC/YqgF family)